MSCPGSQSGKIMRPGFSVLRGRVSHFLRHQSWKMSTLLKIIRKDRGQSIRNTCFRHPAENGEKLFPGVTQCRISQAQGPPTSPGAASVIYSSISRKSSLSPRGRGAFSPFTIILSPFTLPPCLSNSPVISPSSLTSIMVRRPCPTVSSNTPRRSASEKPRTSS